MRYFKISEEDLLRLLRNSLTLKEIQTIKPVSEDLAELELSKFSEIPADAGVSKKPKCPECSESIIKIPELFKYIEIEPGHWKKVDNVSRD